MPAAYEKVAEGSASPTASPSATDQTRRLDEENEKKEPTWQQASLNYAQRVKAYASIGKSSSLFPGDNFTQLSDFLNRPGPWPHDPYTTAYTPRDKFVYATTHDLSCNIEDHQRVTNFTVNELRHFADHKAPKPGSGQLIFLRGFPSASWLNVIGSKYHIDPELFRRQLAYKVPTDKYFDLPATSSSSRSMLKLHITSIGQQQSTTTGRIEGSETLQRHFDALRRRGKVGESIVRRFNWHDEKYFSIEQHIQICVIHYKTSWICK
jgi:hypothetical protein